jgi:hypothetical protein
VIRWEQQESGDWHGFSGELPVATVAKDPDAEREQWAWKIPGLKRPKGWRKPIGHRTTWLEARRSADAYWEKWLAAAGRTSSGSQCRVFRLRSAPKHAAARVPSAKRFP